jgi:integrase
MAARKMTKTRHAGIYKRENRYVVVYYVGGKQKREYVGSLKEALRRKSARQADRDRGELQEESRIPFRRYAEEWIESYIGNGRRGFAESTRDEYRRDLARYAYPFFDERLGRTVSAITPRDVDRWIGWLCDEREQGRRLADASIRRVLSPLRACLATARREGVIRHNPADGAVLPRREQVERVARVGEVEDEGPVKVFTREQLDATLRVAHPRYRMMFRLLAGTGLRWGEVAALRRGDLALDGSRPAVRVRRTLGKPTKRDREEAKQAGRPISPRYKPPKSRHGVRDVPLSPALVGELRSHLATLPPGGPEDLAFPSSRGTPLHYSNVLHRGLRPAVEEAGAGWAAFHTFRHTYASLMIAAGTNIVELSRLLGHHSPEFTLKVYAHLIPGDEAAALDLDSELAGINGSMHGSTQATAREGTEAQVDRPEAALSSEKRDGAAPLGTPGAES